MTLNNKIAAIDAALSFLGLNKIGRAVEDEQEIIFTGCGDNGEALMPGGCCAVNKHTLECRDCRHDDSCWKTPKTEFVFPKERKESFADNWELRYMYEH